MSRYQPRSNHSIGAQRDAFGNVLPTSSAAYNLAGPSNHGDVSPSAGAHDWSGFDAAFGTQPPRSSIAAPPVQFYRNGNDPATGAPWVPPTGDTGFAGLRPGEGHVIADNPDTPRTLYDPGTANVGKAMALTIDPRYAVPGESNIARSTYTQPGATPGQASPIVVSDEAKNALFKAYPNIFQQGHADNAAFVKAYSAAYNPSEPMSTDDVMGMADKLFKPPAVPNSPMYSAGAASAAKSMGSNLVSDALPSLVPNAPLMPPSAGAKAATAVKSAVGNTVNDITGAIGNAAKNTSDFVSGIVPPSVSNAARFAIGAFNPFNQIAGAYGAVRHMLSPDQSTTPQPGAPANQISNPSGVPAYQYPGSQPSQPGSSSLAGAGSAQGQSGQQPIKAGIPAYQFK